MIYVAVLLGGFLAGLIVGMILSRPIPQRLIVMLIQHRAPEPDDPADRWKKGEQ